MYVLIHFLHVYTRLCTHRHMCIYIYTYVAREKIRPPAQLQTCRVKRAGLKPLFGDYSAGLWLAGKEGRGKERGNNRD